MDPESFKGKSWLLVIDKLIIGALIALAFVLYDIYRTTETRQYEEKRAEIQKEVFAVEMVMIFLEVQINRL